MVFYYICSVFTLISAAVSLGFSVDAYLKARSLATVAVTNAKYAISRSASILIVIVGLFFFQNTIFLAAMAIIMIMVQLFDAVIGIKISAFKTFGPLLTAIGNLVVLILFLIN